jgi:hypothetical protein
LQIIVKKQELSTSSKQTVTENGLSYQFETSQIIRIGEFSTTFGKGSSSTATFTKNDSAKTTAHLVQSGRLLITTYCFFALATLFAGCQWAATLVQKRKAKRNAPSVMLLSPRCVSPTFS